MAKDLSRTTPETKEAGFAGLRTLLMLIFTPSSAQASEGRRR